MVVTLALGCNTVNLTLVWTPESHNPKQCSTRAASVGANLRLLISLFQQCDVSVRSSNRLQKIERWWPPQPSVELRDRLEEARLPGPASRTAALIYCCAHWMENSKEQIGCRTTIVGMTATDIWWINACEMTGWLQTYEQKMSFTWRWMLRQWRNTPNNTIEMLIYEPTANLWHILSNQCCTAPDDVTDLNWLHIYYTVKRNQYYQWEDLNWIESADMFQVLRSLSFRGVNNKAIIGLVSNQTHWYCR